MPTTACRNALGFTFDVTADDARLVAYIDEILASFAESAAAAHHYELRTRPGNERSTVLVLDGEPVADAATLPGLIQPLIQSLNRGAVAAAAEHLVLHAAGVEHDGIALVLPGDQETGKSTLATALVRAGFGYLTDEALALDRATLVVDPYPKPLSLDPGSWALFPDLEPEADLDVDTYKRHQWQVPPDAIRPAASGGPCRPAFVVFPRYRPGATTVLEPLARAHAVFALASCTFDFGADAREALEVLTRLVRSAECYRLTLSGLDDACALLENLVATAPAGARD